MSKRITIRVPLRVVGILILSILLVGIVVPVLALNPATVDTSTDQNAVNYGYQRKGFYAEGLFWAFYSDGTNAVYEHSHNGVDWAEGATSIGPCRDGFAFEFNVWFDGTYIHYVRNNNFDTFYRRGTPVNDGSITWSAVEQTVHDGSEGDDYEDPCITVDSNGYAWIGARYDGIGETPYVLKNANNDGTWATDFAYQLSATHDGLWCVAPIPLTNGKVYVIYCRHGQPPLGKLYNAGWGAEENDLADFNIKYSWYFSAVADGDNVHFVYTRDVTYQIRHNERVWGVGWDANDVLVQDTVTLDTYPVLSINTVMGDLYCFWTNKVTNHVYYKEYSAGSWDIEPTDWIDESADQIWVDRLASSFYMDYGGYIGLLYVTKTGSPWNVRFEFLTMPGTISGTTCVTSYYTTSATTCITFTDGSITTDTGTRTTTVASTTCMTGSSTTDTSVYICATHSIDESKTILVTITEFTATTTLVTVTQTTSITVHHTTTVTSKTTTTDEIATTSYGTTSTSVYSTTCMTGITTVGTDTASIDVTHSIDEDVTISVDETVYVPAGIIEQVIFGGLIDLLDDTVTEYNSLVGGLDWVTTESFRHKLVSTDGVIKQLRLKLTGAPGEGKHYDFTLMVNGAPTALTVEIADAATSGSNMVNGIDVTPGDTVSLECDPDSTPDEVYATWTCVFEGDTPYESLIMGGSSNTLDSGATEYGQVMCAYTSWSVTENDHRQVVPTSGTIKDLYVKLNIDPGDAPDAYRLTVRLNGATVAQSLIVTIVADDTTGNDLVHNLDVVAGDVLTLMCEPVDTPSATPYAVWGMTFVANHDGESIVMGGSTDDLDDTDREYIFLTGWEDFGWSPFPFESFRYQLGQVCTLRKLHVLLSGAPGAGNKYDFNLRIAGAASNVVATVSGTDTTGHSGSLSDTVANSDYVTLECDPNSTPNVADAYWGFVCHTGPPITVTQTFLSTTTVGTTVCIYTVIQVIIDPITTVTVTSSSYTTTGTTVVTSTSTETCKTTCVSSTVTLLTFCVTSTIPTSCTTSMITSTQSSTTTTCSTSTWTETTTWVSTSVGA